MSPGWLLPLLLSGLMAVVVLGMALSVPVLVSAVRGSSVSPSGAGPVDLSEVVVEDDLEAGHTDGDVEYDHLPPLGGEHAPVWWECGSYDEPVIDELAVHSLEHGTVWITYLPELAASEVEVLEAALPSKGILSPYPGLVSPVVVSVWGRQLALDGVDDPRLALFLDTFEGGGTAPEPFADCAGGVSDPDDVPEDTPPGSTGQDSQTVGASLS